MKIGIVGIGALGSTVMLNKLKEEFKDDEIVIVDSPSDLKEKGLEIKEPLTLPYTNPYSKFQELTPYRGEKEFICKGKHQYREVNGRWICQCGRTI